MLCVCVCVCAGSTEEEFTQVVSENIREKLTSGTHRPVAWDGVTQRGPELAAQVCGCGCGCGYGCGCGCGYGSIKLEGSLVPGPGARELGRTFSADYLVPRPGGWELGKVRPTGSYPPGRARRE